MTVEDIKQNGNKNPSDELIQLIDSLVMTYKQTTEDRNKQVKAIIDQGRSEGLEDMQIRELIEIALKKHGLSDKTIVRALPQELKHTNMIREHKQVQQIDSSEIVDPDPDNVSLIDKPVYREPDRVEPRPVWNKDSMDTVQEQSFRSQTMTVNPNVPVEDKTILIPFKTQARLNMRDNQKHMDFYVMLDMTVDPDKQIVEIEPIDKMSIVYVRPDQ